MQAESRRFLFRDEALFRPGDIVELDPCGQAMSNPPGACMKCTNIILFYLTLSIPQLYAICGHTVMQDRRGSD